MKVNEREGAHENPFGSGSEQIIRKPGS